MNARDLIGAAVAVAVTHAGLAVLLLAGRGALRYGDRGRGAAGAGTLAASGTCLALAWGLFASLPLETLVRGWPVVEPLIRTVTSWVNEEPSGPAIVFTLAAAAKGLLLWGLLRAWRAWEAAEPATGGGEALDALDAPAADVPATGDRGAG